MPHDHDLLDAELSAAQEAWDDIHRQLSEIQQLGDLADNPQLKEKTIEKAAQLMKQSRDVGERLRRTAQALASARAGQA